MAQGFILNNYDGSVAGSNQIRPRIFKSFWIMNVEMCDYQYRNFLMLLLSGCGQGVTGHILRAVLIYSYLTPCIKHPWHAC